MADGQLTAFPIAYNNADNPNAKADKNTTINGLDLSQNRVLKSAQFSEAITGEKMLANLKYGVSGTTDGTGIYLADNYYFSMSGTKGFARAQLPDDANLDDYKGYPLSGTYYIGSNASMTNVPESWGFVQAMTWGSVTRQLCVYATHLYSRLYNGSSWGNWYQYGSAPLTDISSSIAWNTSGVNFSTKSIYVYYDRSQNSVRGTLSFVCTSGNYWNASTALLTIASSYRPSSDKNAIMLYKYQTNAEMLLGGLKITAEGKIMQSASNYISSAYCQFEFPLD